MNTTVLEAPTVARKSAGYAAPRTAPLHVAEDEEALGIPWYMTMEEVLAELEQAEREFNAGLGITTEELLKRHPEWL
jgi:hypothetical protein